ncbi:MAG: hypothetical protein IJX14_11970, partial [Clostridia bacterium]|nr:hypothetical protein [Clostridia bacterium]
MAHPIPLPEGYVLEGRYVLGSVSRTTAGGIVYTAFDKKLRIMVEVLEYTPADCGLHRKPGETELRGDSAFAEKRMRLLADGSSRMHSADSNIYDVLSANGTAYLVHVAPKNNAVSAQPAADSGIPNDTPETTAEQTRVVDGLFSHEDTDTVPAAEVFSDAEENLPAPSVRPNTDEVPVPSSVPAPASSPAEADSVEERTGGPSVRLLLILLAAGIILLVICCVVFISSLFRITDLPGG